MSRPAGQGSSPGQSPAPDPGFQVSIQRGRRAVDTAAPDPVVEAPPPPEPAPRAAVNGKARPAGRARRATQQRVLAGVLVLAGLVVIGAFALSLWSSAPPGVLARVNGESITVDQVDREILINRALTALLSGQEQTPSRFSTVENLIDQRMKAQDATRAGVTVSDDDVEKFIEQLITRQGKTMDDLDTALKGYGLTRADLIADQHDVVLINKYVGLNVTAGAANQDQIQSLINDWIIQLQRTSKVERFGVPDEPIAPRIGASAPDFKLRDTNDQIHSVAELHGRPVLINFWATWCEPCRDELPVIASAYTSIQKTAPAPAPGVQVLGVAVGSDPDVITSFQKEFGLTYPILPDDSGQIQDLYRVGPIPTSFFIDRQGVIRAIEIGALTPATLQRDLALVP